MGQQQGVSGAGPLGGIRVVDFGQYVAGPLCAMLLGDQGADVVRVDPPGGPRWKAPGNATWNRGKRSIVLDLKRTSDRATATALIERADVVVENFRPGVMERLGLGWDTMRAVNSRLVYCSLPGFAADDRRSRTPGWEGVVSAAAGLYGPLPRALPLSDTPRWLTIPVASTVAASLAVVSIACALFARLRDGVGQHIEVPLFDAALTALGPAAARTTDPRLEHSIPRSGWIAPYRCADGRWLHVHMTPRYIEHFLESTGLMSWREIGLHDRWRVFRDPVMDAELRRRMGALLATRPAEAWESYFNACGSSATIVHSAEEWLEHPHAREALFVSVDDPTYGVMRQPAVNPQVGAPRDPPSGRRPLGADGDVRGAFIASASPAGVRAGVESRCPALDGVHVTDLSIELAGPMAGRLLADFGASVVKVNDASRDTRLAFHLDVNRGKRSVMVDLKTPDGHAWVRHAIASSDVVIENFRPGAAARLGVDYGQLAAAHPRVVYLHLDCYGRGGRWSDRPGWDDLAHAATGAWMRQGGTGAPRVGKLGVPLNDVAAGILGAYGVVLALLERDRTERGALVHTSLCLTAGTMQADTLQQYAGRRWAGLPSGDALGRSRLQRCYPALDGWLFLGAGEEQCEALGRLCGRERGTSLETAIERYTSARTADACVAALAAGGIGAHRVEAVDAVLADRAARAHRRSVVTQDGGGGSITVVGAAPRLSDTPVVRHAAASRMGADLADVVRDERGGAWPPLEPETASADTDLPVYRSLDDSLRWWAAKMPVAVAYAAIDDAGHLRASLSYEELDHRVARLATPLRELGCGERVLIAVNGLEFVVAFLACIRAGVIAVPLPPLDQSPGTRARLVSICADSLPAAIVLPAHLQALWAAMAPPAAKPARQVCPETIADVDAPEEDGPMPDPDAPACLQYTSGSTSEPKGVVLTNRDLLDVCDRVRTGGAYSRASVCLNWQPLDHVSGLFCGVAVPLYGGSYAILMDSASLGRQPMTWLRAIAQFRVTHSGGPVFAYDYCCERLSPSDLEGLDLSNWRVATVSADSVRPAVLHRFAVAFEPAGFRRTSFQACYGLSEAMRVAVSTAGEGVFGRAIDRRSLATGHAVACAADDPDAVSAVAHGPVDGTAVRLRVVDIASGHECAPWAIGEIWLQGPGVARRYWKAGPEDRTRFSGRLADDDVEYLRTNDLGFTDGKHLYVVGRRDNVIIIRGRNLHATDIEATAAAVDARLQAASIAAFAVDDCSPPRVSLVVGITERSRLQSGDRTDLVQRIRRAVFLQHDLPIHDIVLAAPESMAWTSSGKLNRTGCRDAYQAGRWTPSIVGPPENARLDAATDRERLLAEVWLQVLHRRPTARSDTFYELGGDSLAELQLSVALEAHGYRLPPAVLREDSSLANVARHLRPEVVGDGAAPSEQARPLPMLPTQRRILNAYTLALADAPECDLAYFTRPKLYATTRRVERSTLRAVVGALVERHHALRTVFRREGNRWHATLQPTAPPDVRIFEVDGEASVDDPAVCSRLEAVLRDWDPREGGLLRVAAVNGRCGAVVMTVTHHLASDLISEQILADDFLRVYRGIVEGRPARLPATPTPLPEWAAYVDLLSASHSAPAVESPRGGEGSSSHGEPPRQTPAVWSCQHSAGYGARLRAAARGHGRGNLMEVVLAAYLRAAERWVDTEVHVDVAHHGRPVTPLTDLSRTVGPLFYDVPVRADLRRYANPRRLLEAVGAKIDAVADRGLALAIDGAMAPPPHHRARFGFNYQRSVGVSVTSTAHDIVPLAQHLGRSLGAGMYRRSHFLSYYYDSQLRYIVTEQPDGSLLYRAVYAPHIDDRATVERFHSTFESELERLA